MRSLQRTLALSLALMLGSASLPLGCGGSWNPALSVDTDGDVAMPEHVEQQITRCALEHAEHLGDRNHFVAFDLTLASNGAVDEVAVLRSSLGDEPLQACIATALRALSEQELVFGAAEARRQGPVGPEARALLGQMALPQVMIKEAPKLCRFGPVPCVLGVAVVLGAAGVWYLTVRAHVQPSPHPGPVTHPSPPVATAPPIVSAAPMPTATAPPMPTTLTAGDEDLWRRCQQQHETYKKTDYEAANVAKRTSLLENLLNNKKASAQERVEFCSRVDDLINLKKQEHEERKTYMDLDCDKFDWFNKGTTKAQRLADHEDALKNVNAQLKNLYNSRKRFCK